MKNNIKGVERDLNKFSKAYGAGLVKVFKVSNAVGSFKGSKYIIIVTIPGDKDYSTHKSSLVEAANAIEDLILLKYKKPRETCECALCETGKKFYGIIGKLKSEGDREWMKGLYDNYLNVGTQLEIAKRNQCNCRDKTKECD